MPVKRKFPIVLTLLYHEAVQYTGKTFKEQQVFKVHVELNLSHGIYFYKSRDHDAVLFSFPEPFRINILRIWRIPMSKDKIIIIDGVRYHSDRPSNCRKCYFWKNRKAGCTLSLPGTVPEKA